MVTTMILIGSSVCLFVSVCEGVGAVDFVGVFGLDDRRCRFW